MKLDRDALNSALKLNLNEKTIIVKNLDSGPFTTVGEKAFLSCKNIQDLTLPDSIEGIEKWAFAHMKELRVLTIPANNIALAKDVFLDCPKLSEIRIYPDTSGNPGLSRIFATLTSVLKSYSGVESSISSFTTLFTPDIAASNSTHKDWINLYDRVLTDYVKRPDSDGFNPEILGWFNAESEDSQREKYEHLRRIDKITITFLRLRYDMYLSELARTSLYEYINSSLENDSEMWDLLSEDLGKDIENIKILECASALYDSNRIRLIELLNKNSGNPEVISYLLSKEKSHKSDDLWDDLEL